MTTTTACSQPGCTGTILDGYCDVCGSPAGATPEPADQALPAGAAGTSSTVSRASNRLASAPLGSARTRAGTKITRRVGTSSTRLRGARLGAGLTTVPPIPAVDAGQAIMLNPMVPEDRRILPELRTTRSAGRAAASRAGPRGSARTAATGSRSRRSCSRVTSSAGQYEVAGCLAHGGLGWIYVARDKNVSDRWVVLKGLLNSEDPDASRPRSPSSSSWPGSSTR